jgi:hypothetical protein
MKQENEEIGRNSSSVLQKRKWEASGCHNIEAAEADVLEESWICSYCSFINHIDLNSCEICEFSKTGPEKVAGDMESDRSQLIKLHPNLCPSYDSIYIENIIELLKKQLIRSSSLSRYSYSFPYPCHFTQRGLLGSHWSCGYRNIQMLCSSLMQVNEYRDILFDKTGQIPGIRELQTYIEKSWKEGFDNEGANHFKFSLFGKKDWIGATGSCSL